ncbi:gp394 [Bacillus phage G]|uniref:Gp394 n=1 Tax=Bacillus phage G TaxID=2884420 RepID=G3MAD5_9CAUD|nr:gp394 [Bacillus phage G]AEO93653.1 gp394 [Bacillus phage G]
MINNLIKLYIYESFTLVSFITLAVIASVLELKLVISLISIFTMLIFVVWFFTSRLILRLLVEGVLDEEDGSKIKDERNNQKNK